MNQPSTIRIVAIVFCFFICNNSDLFAFVQAEDQPPQTQSTAPEAGQHKQTKTESEAKPPQQSRPIETALQELNRLAVMGRENFSSIKSGHMRFSRVLKYKDLNPEITPEQCKALTLNLDLANNPEKIGFLINALSDAPSPKLKSSNWNGPTELYFSGDKIRTSTKGIRPNEFDVHITDPKTTLLWDSANQIVTVKNRSDDNRAQYSLRNFLAPLPQFPPLSDAAIESSDEQISFTLGDAAASDTMVMDRLSGFLSQLHSINKKDETLHCWLGWKTFGKVRFPQIVAKFIFRNGELIRWDVERIESAQFNISIADHAFQLGAPAGASIHNEKTQQYANIFEDVFDVTSDEQLKEAGTHRKVELTPEDLRGIAAAKKIYDLEEGQHVARVGAPFSLARKYVPQMLGQRPTLGPSQPSWIISHDGEKRNFVNVHTNGTFAVKAVLTRLTGVPETQIIGDQELLNSEIVGDFVLRKGSKASDVLPDLKNIFEDEFQTKLVLESRKTERPVYLIRGELKLNLNPNRDRIEVHGGDYKGLKGEVIQFGNLDQFSQSLAKYIDAKVVNDSIETTQRLKWSERWYDAGIRANRPEGGFKLETDEVLRIVSQQTGLKFTEKSETLNVIVLERDD